MKLAFWPEGQGCGMEVKGGTIAQIVDKERQTAGNKGLVFDLQRYSIHDGPGIRTLIFLKGCCLRCFWCCNPESIDSKQEVLFSSERCIKCGSCTKVCPQRAIKKIDDEIRFERDLCISCGKCCQVCSAEARKLVGEWVDVENIMTEIKKDELFYRNSGGGVTISGGEPAFQGKFTTELLRRCKNQAIHTAVETSGYVKWEVLRKILSYTDLVLLDIKHMDPVKHEELTGVTNELILENVKRIGAMKIPLIIRFPLVPGYNDSPQNLRSTAELVAKLEGVRELHILPYHSFGVHKYVGLGKQYSLGGIAAPSEEEIDKVRKLFEEYELKVQIGG